MRAFLNKIWDLFKSPKNNNDWTGQIVNMLPTGYYKQDMNAFWGELIDQVDAPVKELTKIYKEIGNSVWYEREKTSDDVWQRASVTAKLKTGDCEDFAILLAARAIQSGYDVRVALGFTKVKGAWKGHSFNLWYKPNGSVWVIDAVNSVFDDARICSEYKVDHSFNREHIWEHN